MDNPMTAEGSLIVGGTAGAPGELVAGAVGDEFKMTDAGPAWVTAPVTAYTVQAEDTIDTIAATAGITTRELIELNRGKIGPSPIVLTVGMVLTVPPDSMA